MNSSNPLRACIYTRVSSGGQVEKFGLKVQEEKCSLMVNFKDWTLTNVYTDAGISGTYGPDKRPALKQLLEDGEKRLFDCVVIYALDRLGRKTTLVLSLIDKFKDMDIKLVSCKENLDTTTPMGAFFVTMSSAIVQLERDNIVARTREGSIQRKKLDGDVGGIFPFGYTRSNGAVIIIPGQANVIKLIYKLRDDDKMTQVRIAKYLNSHDILSPKDGLWTQGTISKILKKREIYSGGLINNNENDIRWPMILSSDVI